ncbi:hypothetical protein [Dysgonomonas termitidis]|uniref:Uncharacterized protein n=1 Tax=Dysgonomonas termitidis TaxID=1516126 RepID=A0ABV9L3V9_9BACT
MARQLIARGQVNIQILNDAYTINQSVSSYVFAAASNGTVLNAVTVTSAIKVMKGDTDFTAFTIGSISKPAGFSAVTVNNTDKTITYTVAANTANLPDNGIITIPLTIAGVTYSLSFAWSKAKAGAAGKDGADANLLDWVADWNTNKTVIGTNSVITPKLFAGVKNADGTLTGTAIGRFPLSVKNSSGSIATETIDGIYGFRAGVKTFAIDNTGSVQLGNGNQVTRYNAATGKIEFGSEVSLNWTSAIATAKTEAVNAAATDAATKVNVIRIGTRNYIKNSAFAISSLSGVIVTDGVAAVLDTATKYQGYNTIKITQTTVTGSNANTGRAYFNAIRQCNPASFCMYVKASEETVLRIRTGGTEAADFPIGTSWQLVKLENKIPTSVVALFGATTAGVTYNMALPMLVEGTKAADWSPAPEDTDGRITDARAVADAITAKANNEGWATKLTYIGSTGIFTGTLSAGTIEAITINALQITAGTIDTARLNVDALKASLITAANIDALTLNVTKGKIGGWSIDADSIFRGTKNNTSGAYTGASGAITIGSNGVRGFKWRLESTGAGALAGGNIAWDASGNVTDLYLNRLPKDEYVPFWDFDAPNIPNEPRDASAAAIVASELLELSQLEDNPQKAKEYKTAAISMLIELSSDKYQSRDCKPSFLLHSVGHWPNKSEMDASINYADYYYIEALIRYKKMKQGLRVTDNF